jgi:hypothetical protein
MRRLTTLACVLLAAAGGAAAANAQGSGGFFFFGLVGASGRHVQQWDLPATVEGSVVVHFSGGGRTGTTVFTPGRVGQLTVARATTRAGRRFSAVLALASQQSADIAARVERDGGGVCSDTASESFHLAAARPGRDAVRLRLAATGPREQGFLLTETACGGPLSEDVAHALPAVTLTGAQLKRGGFTIDLRRTGAFAGAGLRGTVESSMVVTVGRRRPPRKGGAIAAGQPQNVKPVRVLTVGYRVARVSGVAHGSFSGSGEVCTELDSCGATASWTVRAAAATHGVATLEAVAPLRRPLADLRSAVGLSRRGNARGIQAFGAGGWLSPQATATADLRRAGATVCEDTRHIGAGAIELTRDGGAMRVVFGVGGDAMRTSCPGPGLVDSSQDAQQSLATGSVPLRAFGRRTIVLRLTRGVSRHSDGWSGRTTANVTVVLRRTRTTVKTLRF